MTRTRTGDAFMPADEYGRSLPQFSVNLLVRNVGISVNFYRDIVGAIVRYSDNDFAALDLNGRQFSFMPITPTNTIHAIRDCKFPFCAAQARNYASSALIRTQSNNVPNTQVLSSYSLPRISLMAGVM